MESVSPAYRLRPAAPADRSFLYRVYSSTRQEELAAVAWDQGQVEAFLRMQFDAQDSHYVKNYPGAVLEVIEIDGCCAGRFYHVRWEKEIRIMDIALLPEYRRKGVGASILNLILAEGQALGLPVTIHVERMNPALRLYERLGFRMVEDKGVYLLLEWKPE